MSELSNRKRTRGHGVKLDSGCSITDTETMEDEVINHVRSCKYLGGGLHKRKVKKW